MTSIREIDIERDASDLVGLDRECSPTTVVSVASFVHRLGTVPERSRARAWVAEVDGRVVGRAYSFLSLFATASRIAALNVAVRERQRRQGIGSALFEIALRHAHALRAEQLVSNFHENAAGVAFAQRRGFVQVRAETEACLDPRRVTAQPAAGVDLRAIDAVDPRLAYEVDMEATEDMPSTEPFEGMAYEEWEDHVLRHPLFAPSGSFLALVEGEPAAVSLLTADSESGRATSMFTGTRRAYRGRGLALAVKLASTHWCATNGITKMFTYNDATNAPMLAVNRRLGYEPLGRRVEYLRDLAG
ncbi:MAG TPA: GNAT family N-acetyltransferase [Gaiellaceae bacterium]|jgi:GNAT superfamily N-acetyltransferase|nr:GNAT family N-acetyltransferase [Gaiellaceae bacterium]